MDWAEGIGGIEAQFRQEEFGADAGMLSAKM
jgi:hypothetical protein